jgi:hypothetical protein
MQRRAGAVIALVLFCACGGKKSEKTETWAAPSDIEPLIYELATAPPDDPPAVVAAVAAWCGDACPCLRAKADGCERPATDGISPELSWAGEYLAKTLAAQTGDAKENLAWAMSRVEMFAAPAAPDGVTLPSANNVAPPGSWGVMVIAKDGRFSAFRAPRIRLGDKGAVIEPASTIEGPFTDALEASKTMYGLAPKEPTPPASMDAFERPSEDEPPPPEPEEEEPEDGTEPSGTTMALDEGKMGKKDTDRAEGQIHFDHSDTDPELAREQAIEAAKQAGILGSDQLATFDPKNPCPDGFGFGRSGGVPAAGAGKETIGMHQGTPGGVAIRRAPPIGHVVVLGDAAVSARAVVDMIHQSSALGVAKDGAVVALSAVACSGVRTSGPTILVDRGAKPSDVVAQVPAKTEEVELLLSDQLTYGDLIAVVDALLDAGVGEIGLRVGKTDLEGRVAHIPRVLIGQPSMVGDMDKAIIRRYIKRNLAKIRYCYEKELLMKPGIEGTVSTQFFISPKGTVKTANASGVNEEVANCVASVIKAIEFPKPRDGGGVQVNYPFTFRPTGG